MTMPPEVFLDTAFALALTPDKHFQQAGHRALLRDAIA
jgi:hypothetical protein